MPQNTWKLPEGVSLEMIDEYARATTNANRRASYARHPERALRNRITSAANLLHKYGHIDDQTHAAILASSGGGRHE